jgi:hypothetical protein
VNVYDDYVRYLTTVEQKANSLHYERTYEIDQVVVPVDQVKSMRQLYRTVALDERASAARNKQRGIDAQRADSTGHPVLR